MFRHQADGKVPAAAYSHWLMMAASAGYTNAAAFLAVGIFVTHVTGFATLFGVHAAKGQVLEALTGLAVPLFFLGGALLAGLLVTVREDRGQRPHYDWVMAFSALGVLLPVLLHAAGWLGEFGALTTAGLRGNAVFLASICLASGMQNAALSAASHHSVRITHMTGLTTDLGLGLARLIGGHTRERKPTWLRFGTILAFLAGSVLGALAAPRFGYNAFLLPALVCAYAAWRGRVEKAQMGKKSKAARKRN
jgi:uncharacterized membrane protein YoaK (UPF0700 family)